MKKKIIGNKKPNNKRKSILNELSTHVVFKNASLIIAAVWGHSLVLRIKVKDKKKIIILIFKVNNRIIKRKCFKLINLLQNSRIIALKVHPPITAKKINKLFSKFKNGSIYFNI